ADPVLNIIEPAARRKTLMGQRQVRDQEVVYSFDIYLQGERETVFFDILHAKGGVGGMSGSIFILNGPNLNFLWTPEPHIYGRETLADVEADCRRLAAEFGLTIKFQQSNAESQLIDWIHEARESAVAIIINPGAFTHTSIAILDALNACTCPIIEVHISNVHRRESFRHTSYVSLAATGVMAGFGTHGYQLAIRHVAHLRTDAKG